MIRPAPAKPRAPRVSPHAERDADALRDYLSSLEHERHLSPHTLSGYARDLATLLALLGEVGLVEARSDHLRRAVAQLAAAGQSGRSLARSLSAWRGLYRWLARHRGCGNDPCVGLRAPRAPRHLPQALSPEAVQRLLEADGANEVLTARDRAMFELLYSSGLRLAELVALDVDDGRLDLAAGEVTVIGKGRKTRVVPVGAPARAALAAWLRLRASLARPHEKALFVGARGARIAPGVVQRRLRQLGLRQGLEARVHPHVLRHSFASHLLQSSQDLRAVQELLGHASIATTQVYTHLDFQALAKVYDAAHPRARKKR